ncbi:lysophospholipase L1-like esterase [Stackebrandtia albiflava]|uniref:Lysophospholipase L1-like esterase n=1 Tax=Stackebrandtia albiflava TaxID=406432 RepID=A0A562V1Q7_9ACTN|nr:SGNH/GDSL hydrolase family protein [Stackebrandtia albiflava]TWJ11846.1 lysophospholipase L1-like esterase [Stackebrandtia albiflava]
MTHRFNGFAALGDSFTEGMNDLGPDGRYRGWADLVADRLSLGRPELRYANLAVRGRLFDAVVDEQVPAALRLRPDLVSFVAGGNDALRRRFNPQRLGTRLHEAVRVLTASGATVILFTSPLPPPGLPAAHLIRTRLSGLNDAVRRVAQRHSSVLVDLWSDTPLNDRSMWSDDRLHMSPLGHARVAAMVCAALEVEADEAWNAAPPPATPAPWTARRREDLKWARGHLAPWVRRRINGISSGDTVTAKRPTLERLRKAATEAGA